ncbi:glycosyltransferase involved in cell wall biosynthesis [Mycobacterium sp. MAA66]|uniref:glycosyltransferase family 4 protein n=1 Tax=Mycobacterium sp. MAA66 TaxID=3156297 RepID=UPI003516863B
MPDRPDQLTGPRAEIRSVLLLCWRDTGHPQGGGSETYLQRIGAVLASSGVAVTLRTARYRGSVRREVVDGVQISRGGGRHSVYIWAGLAMVLARMGLGPLRGARPDVVIDSQNGIPFLARLAYGRRSMILVHHCHRDQWPVAGRLMSRFGWFVESRLSPRLHRHNQYVTVSLPSARDLVDLGVEASRIAVVRNGVDAAPTGSLALERSAGPRVVVLSRLVPHKQIEDVLDAVAGLLPSMPDLRLDVVGGGWWSDRLVAHADQLGIGSAVTFHGHVSESVKHELLQQAWVHALPSRKEGWALAVIEAAQHGVPTVGYRSSGGLTDSVVDGVTGLLVDDHRGLVAALQMLLTDPVLREQLGVKAQLRSAEFSWPQSASAMLSVASAVRDGEFVSGIV